MENEELYSRGIKMRRKVLGDPHVDKAEANKTEFDAEFQGSVWGRPGLSARERSLITIALMAALGHEEELALHLRATRNTGATENDIKEVLLHTAVYAGVPAANAAFRIAKEIVKENKK